MSAAAITLRWGPVAPVRTLVSSGPPRRAEPTEESGPTRSRASETVTARGDRGPFRRRLAGGNHAGPGGRSLSPESEAPTRIHLAWRSDCRR
eukprot:767988-Hanusia_phi.AAC.5